MKKTNILMAPLFTAVVLLLSVGALGELFSSLFSKVKSILSFTSTEATTATETATQLR